MEKETSDDPADNQAVKKEARKPKRRRPKAIGLVAVESKTKNTPPSPEHIGHMLMSAETKPAKLAQKAISEAARFRADTTEKADRVKLVGKRAETLNRAELMSLSDKIIIDGSSLRQIYETHLVGERGLRRLVAEYLHDGDLKQALRLEVVERERDFERDPVMRDMTPTVSPQVTGSSPSQKTALDELLAQADVDAGDNNEETAFFKARARYEAQTLSQHKQRRRVIDIGLAAVIFMLLLLVVMLSMSRL